MATEADATTELNVPVEGTGQPEAQEEERDEELSSTRDMPDALAEEHIVLETEGLSFSYGDTQALYDIDLQIPKNNITAFIGPSGCGKSTLIRCFNRMNDVISGTHMEGKVYVEGIDIYDERLEVEALRKRVGMVFQKSNPFPMSIRENITFGPRIHGERDDDKLDHIVERSLKQADLWKEVSDRLDENALDLSGGQQQRLCIARCLANEPDIILFDEPASALDPISTGHIEDTIERLAEDYTCAIVTHNMQQAARISDFTAFLYLGRLIEYSPTPKLFKNPKKKRTEEYITGRFG